MSDEQIGTYIDELRRRRSAGGVFATKLQYWQYRACLRNKHGKALFEGAIVVHLFRADVFHQFTSVLKAIETGRYDFSDRATCPPQSAVRLLSQRNLLETAEDLVREDAGFRRLFIFLGIQPIFVEFDELRRDWRGLVDRIGQALSVAVNRQELDKALALAGPYSNGAQTDQSREEELLGIMRNFAFQK